ncbi:hypothetical protein GOP47_0012551 [Adiantum capillus-veneris]|uniref:Pentatricopeptide repeat-containing protein n=1 Tax=Adiantum capillus-veneris TaxID=13818 RepID=A0A9D4ZGK5_ADICA|nr:hypothetical protein GOP47_0012551 [Adiantum capillus-veneris]
MAAASREVLSKHLGVVKSSKHARNPPGRRQKTIKNALPFIASNPSKENKSTDPSIFQKQPITTELADQYAAHLRKCGEAKDLFKGKLLHQQIRQAGFDTDRYLGNHLLQMYGKCGALQDACLIFAHMPHKNVFTWNLMMGAYIDNGLYKAALKTFQDMLALFVVPDAVTIVSALTACSTLLSLAEDVAESLFNKMPEKNLVSWSAMIAAYAQHGHSTKVLQVSRRMQRAGLIPNEITLISILTACSHAGLIDEARYWFTSMVNQYGISPVEEHYNCMIDLLGRMGRLDQGEELLRSMPPGTSSLPWLTLLGACKKHADVKRARHVGGGRITVHANCRSRHKFLNQEHLHNGPKKAGFQWAVLFSEH